MTTQTIDQLLRENEELRLRLEEAEDAIFAIRAGEVDAVVVEDTCEQVYTLETADKPYRLLVEQARPGTAILTVEGIILYCNGRFADLFQRPLYSLLGKPIHDFVTIESGPLIETLLRDGQSAEVKGDVALQRSDGTTFPAYLGISFLREGAHGLCLMVTDLTEQRHYQELLQTKAALQASEARLRDILDNTPAMAYLVDTQQRFIFINRRWESIFNLTNQQVVGRSIYDFFPEDVANQFAANNRKVLEDRSPAEFEEDVTHLDGLHTYLSSKVPLFDSAGAAYAICGLSIDVTDRLRIAAALKDADRKKDEFLATLAHELRNPLAPIRNAVQLLNAKGLSDPDLNWGLGVIDRQVMAMGRMLEDLLDVSRVARGKLELRRERVDLTIVLNAALEISRPVIDAAGHKLTVTLPPKPIHLEADPMRLAQVFANLLNNAARYTEEGGHIWLTAELQGSELIVSVKDDGIGVCPQILPHVFEVFAQSPQTVVRSQGGLGIGLSLVKALVELHGGGVEVFSGGEGLGSEFVVHLPVTFESLIREPARSKEDDSRIPVSKCRILIVDDNRDCADTLAKLLSLMGHEIITAYDGEEAVEAACASRPEVALLDIGMPKFNGYEACRRIREQPWGKEMFLIAMTGWGQAEDRRRTDAAGFNVHMVKPADPVVLMQLIASRSSTERVS